MSDAAINPRRQECLGKYLFGSGYFAREDQTKGILTGQRTEATFCNECPLKERCEREHGLRVRASFPQEVELFERQVRQATARGMTRTLAAMARMKSGDPDPYMKLALANYHDGVNARRAMRDRVD